MALEMPLLTVRDVRMYQIPPRSSNKVSHHTHANHQSHHTTITPHSRTRHVVSLLAISRSLSCLSWLSHRCQFDLRLLPRVGLCLCLETAGARRSRSANPLLALVCMLRLCVCLWVVGYRGTVLMRGVSRSRPGLWYVRRTAVVWVCGCSLGWFKHCFLLSSTVFAN
jgi:hypothetical protein